jgi:hypothetical protein
VNIGKLGDILGDDFEKDYQEKRQQRRDEANKVEKKTLMEICYKAIKAGGFDGEEPRFRFDAGNIDHDVLLMESPTDDLQTFRWPLGDSAKTQGMFHLDDLFSLAFQENMLDLLDKIDTGEYYLVVGRYEETTQSNSDGEEETYYNINPVRGIVPIEVADQYASKYEEQMEGTPVEEQAEQQSPTDDGEDDSDDDVDLGGLDDGEPEVTDDDIVEIFHVVGDQAPAVLEQVANGDQDSMDKLCGVVDNNIDGDVTNEHVLDVFEDAVESIPGRHEDEEEEDDGIDLGGIAEDDSESEDTESNDGEDESEPDKEPEPAAATTDGSSDSADEDADEKTDVDDWF